MWVSVQVHADRVCPGHGQRGDAEAVLGPRHHPGGGCQRQRPALRDGGEGDLVRWERAGRHPGHQAGLPGHFQQAVFLQWVTAEPSFFGLEPELKFRVGSGSYFLLNKSCFHFFRTLIVDFDMLRCEEGHFLPFQFWFLQTLIRLSITDFNLVPVLPHPQSSALL